MRSGATATRHRAGTGAVSTVARPQHAPPANARTQLRNPPIARQGSITSNRPTAAIARKIQWRAVGLSPSSSHAKAMTQNGIVYASSAILPAPPSTSDICTSSWNAAVCARPIRIVSRNGVGAPDSPRHQSSVNSSTVPNSVRSAEKSSGPM